MSDLPAWSKIILLTFFAGFSSVLGAIFASKLNIKRKSIHKNIEHFIISFGGGALLSAVALVLVPEGIRHSSMATLIISFLVGGCLFAYLDNFLAKSNLPYSNLVAMFSDFLPEALALGASCAVGGPSAILIAVLIALQNFPEGFSAYKEMAHGGIKGRSILLTLTFVSFMGPVAGLIGFYFLAQLPEVTSIIMLFASGGILYIVFQDIAPEAKLDSQWIPSLGAVCGFLLGVIGHVLSGGH